MDLKDEDMDNFADDILGTLVPDKEPKTDDDDLGLGLEEKLEDANNTVENKSTETTNTETTAPNSTTQTASYKPSTWRQEAMAHWDKLPPEVRGEVEKREREMLDGIASYKENAEIGKRAMEAFEPFREILTHFNIDPVDHARDLFAVHHAMLTGDKSQKVQIVSSLMQELGLSVADFGGAAAGSAADPAKSAPLTQAPDGLSMRLSNVEARLEQDRRTAIRSQVSTFAADPANKYFTEVADTIVQLRNEGARGDLATLYERACWTHPGVRQKMIAEQRESELAAQRKADAERAAKAKEASGANLRVRQNPKPPTSRTPLSLEQTLNDTFAKYEKE